MRRRGERRRERLGRAETIRRKFLERCTDGIVHVRRDARTLRGKMDAALSVITLATMACAVGPTNGGSPASIS